MRNSPKPPQSAISALLFVALAALMATSFIALTGEPAAAQVTPLEDEPDEAPNLGRITGTPDAGPAPEDAGDRGGLIQLSLAAILFSGLAFIATRVAKEVKRNRNRDQPSRARPS